MTRPTARVLALLEILQAGGTRSATDLARRLEVDERTVRRYIEHLIDLDVPVRAERGRHGGYRLAQGFRMPPLMLTDDEALAVMLGLVAGQRSGFVAASAAAGEAALAKVRRVLPVGLGLRLDALLATADFVDSARPVVAAQTTVLLLVAEAARDRRAVEIDYIDRGNRLSARVVHPYGIVARSGRWYVVGADSISADIRTFRLDRIDRARMISGTFTVPAGFDAAARLSTGAPFAHEVSVRVEASVEHARSRLPAALATVEAITPSALSGDPEEQRGDWVRVLIRAERLDWIPALLASLDRPFVIEHPEALRESVNDLARRLAAYAVATV